jgi:hypothetical protein
MVFTRRDDVQMTDKRKSKLFCIGTVLMMLLCALGISLFGHSLGPPVGDLTRIGGLSEKKFGFRGTGSGFAENHFSILRYDDLITGHNNGEIVVFGDSFSAAQTENITWTNTLYTRSGRNIDFVNIETLREIRKYFKSEVFKKNPPEVVIVEMGERTVFRRARSIFEEANCALPIPPAPIQLRPVQVKRTKWVQRSDFSNFDERISWGALALRFRIFKPSKTIEVDLSNSNLFSNVYSNKLLLFQSDIIRHTAEALFPMSAKTASGATVCAVRDMINAAAGLSSIYIVIAPDKRSIYENWIQTPLPKKVINFPKVFANQFGDHYIDLYKPLVDFVRAGEKDVYFPNDTHWSDKGHTLVGNTIADAIGK